MNKTILAGVKLPQIFKSSLDKSLKTIKVGDKKSLYFLYSEFVLRANLNSSYRQVLNNADLAAIDGKGLEWSNFMLHGNPRYNPTNLVVIRVLWNLFKNMVMGAFLILGKKNMAQTTFNQVILGRDYIYTLLREANNNKWKVALIGSNKQVHKTLQVQYPHARILVWEGDPTSPLMRDNGRQSEQKDDIKFKHTFLNAGNLLSQFPDLIQARGFVRRIEPELVIVCIGGASGKQEFFIDNIKQDSSIQYGLAVGVGAAFDHLGSGAAQVKTSSRLESMGLEWLHRIISNPQRAMRTWYSIYKLWWITSLQPFLDDGQVVNLANFKTKYFKPKI
jgi:UDP-N-acetyl-D-mannosaminuronic acid transferase (WecB/TagA/CpsF family)